MLLRSLSQCPSRGAAGEPPSGALDSLCLDNDVPPLEGCLPESGLPPR